MSDPDSRDKPRSGRVRHDSGGRAIWEWARESGRYAIDSTSRLLKKLELTGITLMGDDARPWEKKPGAAPGADPQHPGGSGTSLELPPDPGPEGPRSQGFNPYDTRTPVGRGATPPRKPAAPPRPRVTQPPARKRGFFARLFDRR